MTQLGFGFLTPERLVVERRRLKSAPRRYKSAPRPVGRAALEARVRKLILDLYRFAQKASMADAVWADGVATCLRRAIG